MEEMDFHRAMSNPAGVFGTPDRVVENKSLTASQKREILLRWQAEAIHC